MRLQRVGRKHEPTFRLVLTDSKNSTKSGRFKEILGSFDARKTTEAFKTERINHWLSQGISLTPTVHNLFITHGLIKGTKKNVLPRKTPIVKEVKETPVVETPVEAVAETPVSTETEA
ncbi:30S ribosomal protein S16 [Candidatus Parcubacteria bacterium]|nr:30S ribosomal protein S16 [Candidatus Parcubacteria bacterium]